MARCRPSWRRPVGQWATACPPQSPLRCASRTGPSSASPATAAQYGVDLLVILVDNGAYGTIRMHQERDYPKRISATELANPDFAKLAEAYGGWSERVENTEAFGPAFARAMERKGIRLLHCVTDVEVITNQTTIAAIHAR
jgi:acetolactate synthase-1/2/3 large subunit